MLSASSAVAATNEKFQPRPRPKSATAVATTLSIHRSEITDSAISTRPPYRATRLPDPVDHPAHHQHQRVHADHVRADDREDVVRGVVLVVHDDRAR